MVYRTMHAGGILVLALQQCGGSAVPSNIPVRDLSVFMVGAGLSTAFNISNTPSLLEKLATFSRSPTGKWLADENLEPRLKSAFEFFYPDAKHPGFRPDPVDFFSALRTFIDIGSSFRGTGQDDAAQFYRTLKRGIAHVLINEMRANDDTKLATHPYLTEMLKPGHVVITSNWDPLLERFAALNNIPLRLATSSREFSNEEITLLKLHGSVDWCKMRDRTSGYADDQYASLTELRQARNPRRSGLPTGDDSLVRVKTDTGDVWQKIKSRLRDPWMVTMVTGKSDDLGPLQNVWRDAYRALSRAKTLEIVGYSMPPDDAEIRTLLRAGVQRGGGTGLDVTVRNPSPEVHYRVRAFLDRMAASDYQPV